MPRLFRERTPIESFELNGREIYVKREDLYGNPPAPPLGKLRGLRILVKKLRRAGVRTIGCWDTRVSKLGQGLAAVCSEFDDLRCIVSYPTRKGTSTPESIAVAESLGADVHPVPGGRLTISFARAREYVHEQQGFMLPFGMECPEAVQGVEEEARRVPAKFFANGTIILSCGSGVTLAGLLRGLQTWPSSIIGVSSGRSVSNIQRALLRHTSELPSWLRIEEPLVPYGKAIDHPCPFPSHPNYDLKAWKYLEDRLDELKDPILFWNIGA